MPRSGEHERSAGRILERGRRGRARADTGHLEPGIRGAGPHRRKLGDGRAALRVADRRDEFATAHDRRHIRIQRLGRALDRRIRGRCPGLGGRDGRDELRE